MNVTRRVRRIEWDTPVKVRCSYCGNWASGALSAKGESNTLPAEWLRGSNLDGYIFVACGRDCASKLDESEEK